MRGILAGNNLYVRRGKVAFVSSFLIMRIDREEVVKKRDSIGTIPVWMVGAAKRRSIVTGNYSKGALFVKFHEDSRGRR